MQVLLLAILVGAVEGNFILNAACTYLNGTVYLSNGQRRSYDCYTHECVSSNLITIPKSKSGCPLKRPTYHTTIDHKGKYRMYCHWDQFCFFDSTGSQKCYYLEPVRGQTSESLQDRFWKRGFWRDPFRRRGVVCRCWSWLLEGKDDDKIANRVRGLLFCNQKYQSKNTFLWSERWVGCYNSWGRFINLHEYDPSSRRRCDFPGFLGAPAGKLSIIRLVLS